jgi:hypothetical protein
MEENIKVIENKIEAIINRIKRIEEYYMTLSNHIIKNFIIAEDIEDSEDSEDSNSLVVHVGNDEELKYIDLDEMSED